MNNKELFPNLTKIWKNYCTVDRLPVEVMINPIYGGYNDKTGVLTLRNNFMDAHYEMLDLALKELSSFFQMASFFQGQSFFCPSALMDSVLKSAGQYDPQRFKKLAETHRVINLVPLNLPEFGPLYYYDDMYSFFSPGSILQILFRTCISRLFQKQEKIQNQNWFPMNIKYIKIRNMEFSTFRKKLEKERWPLKPNNADILNEFSFELSSTDHEAKEAISNTWIYSCKINKIDPLNPDSLPSLFTLDARARTIQTYIYKFDSNNDGLMFKHVNMHYEPVGEWIRVPGASIEYLAEKLGNFKLATPK